MLGDVYKRQVLDSIQVHSTRFRLVEKAIVRHNATRDGDNRGTTRSGACGSKWGDIPGRTDILIIKDCLSLHIVSRKTVFKHTLLVRGTEHY